MSRRFLPPLLAALILVLFAPSGAAAQSDDIAMGCARSKLRSAGKACSCLHKAWSKAAASGEAPDFLACEEKLGAALAKAETKATAAGGACPTGEDSASVAAAILASADRTVSQVGRGVITPAPNACDGISKLSSYSGGNYARMPKCVKPADGDPDCSSAATGRKMSRSLEKDMTCPECPEDEEGCVPRVPTIVPGDIEERDGLCCLKTDTDTTKSVTFAAKCTLCVAE